MEEGAGTTEGPLSEGRSGERLKLCVSMGDADDEVPTTKVAGPAAVAKSKKFEASFGKAVGGKLKLKGSVEK